MSVCYVLSDSFYDELVKNVDSGQAHEIIDRLETRKQEAENAKEILERKTYHGTRRVRQIKLGQWRIASLYVRGIDIAEVIQLCYLYNKNENDEPDRDVLREIDQAAERLFTEATDWPPDEESEYLAKVETKFPDL